MVEPGVPVLTRGTRLRLPGTRNESTHLSVCGRNMEPKVCTGALPTSLPAPTCKIEVVGSSYTHRKSQ